LQKKNPALCKTCYWGNPSAYNHVALKEIRRLAIEWQGDEVKDYEKLDIAAHKRGEPIPEYVKKVLKQALNIK